MKRFCALAIVCCSAALGATQSAPPAAGQITRAGLTVRAVSTDATLVTGGDVLVEVSLPASGNPLKVTLAGRDVTSAFRRMATPGRMQGVITGLVNGRTVIEASAGAARAMLEITNYPITGPVISGPWQQPFICQTEAFTLPDGSSLGAPLDANCSARTVVQHVYLPTAPQDEDQPFKPLPAGAALPADVAKTTTTAGRTVNFIVRVETGTMNRGIYQNAILHDPTVDPEPTPFTPPQGWNRRLLAMHGSGCPGGWYIQGARMGVTVLQQARLAQGYAVFINTLNHPTNSCNAFLAGETTMMGKEHFVETFGVPEYTISAGGSGGAYTSLQVADAFPGLIDGVDIRATFPDALAIALSGLDAHLLMHYALSHPGALTEAQQVAISGYEGMQAFLDAANQSQRTDPVPNRVDLKGYSSARFNAAVPEAARYHPTQNPKGARPTVFDAAKNIYGVDAATGAALRPFDNVGVQYGLAALNAGVITPAQFLDLNEKIGGVDGDSNYIATRSVGNPGAIRRAYQAGLMLGANGGLKDIPIFDNATSTETRAYHYGWFHFALRERVRQANGDSGNMVMWRSTSGSQGQRVFDAWMEAIAADRSTGSRRAKTLRAKPAEARDGCFDRGTPPKFVADALPFTRRPESPCSELFPVYSFPRREAGGPLAADVLKCQTRPVDLKDYQVQFSAAEQTRLKTIFSSGVCDWSKPGVNQVPVVGWASFGPSPTNRIGNTVTR
jgi:hypothetical protein